MKIILLYGFAIFFLMLAVNIIIWRLFKPKEQIKFLFIIFFVLAGFIIVMVSKINLFNFHEALSLTTIYLSLAMAYIMTYPAIQAWSPSLKIIYYINKSKDGLTQNEIHNLFNDNSLILDRVDDLIVEKFLIQDNKNNLNLTFKGKFLAVFFYFYRKLYGLDIGKG